MKYVLKTRKHKNEYVGLRYKRTARYDTSVEP